MKKTKIHMIKKKTCDNVDCKFCFDVRTSRIKPEKRGDDELVMIVIVIFQ